MAWRRKTADGSLLAALVLLAGGCSGGSGAGQEAQNAAAAESATAKAAVSPEEAERLRLRAVTALLGVLPGAAAAEYANLRRGSADSTCGEVDAGDGLGRRPFVVTADGTSMVSQAPLLRLEDPNDPFPNLYMRYCASTEELRRIGARLQNMRPSELILPSGGDVPPFSLPLSGDDADAVEPTVEPPDANGGAEPRRPNDDSFFNSVLRTPGQTSPPG